MKKRIISLFMALCMLLLAVPVFVLPATAAEHEELTTKFDTNNNWPSYVADPATWGSTLTEFVGWNGGWSMGRMYKGAYARYTGVSYYSIINEGGPNAEWRETGVYLGNEKMILSNSTYAANQTAVAYTYTAQYTGQVTLDLEKLILGSPIGGNTEASVLFAIFINDVMVYPQQGADTLNPENWATVKSLDEVNAALGEGKAEYKVQRGDNITFAVGANGTCNQGVIMVPTVTYDAGWKVVPDVINDYLATNGTTWPETSALPGLRPLQQLDARWTLGSYNVTDDEFIEYSHFNTKAGRTYGVYQSESRALWDEVGSIYLGASANPVLKGGFHLGASDEEFAAYRVQVLASCVAQLSMKDLQLISAENTAVDGTAVIEVYKNGTLFKTLEYTVANGEASASAYPAAVKKGDELTFIVRSADAAAAGNTVVAVAGSPMVVCSDVTSFLSETPADGESGVAIENADLLVGREFGLRLFAYATQDIYENQNAKLNLYVWSSTVEGEKTAENATAILPMTYNDDFAYYADFMGFSIRELSDDFYVQVVVTEGETVLVKSGVANQNVVAMLTEQYENEKDPTTKQLLIDMLNYAAAAQSYFNYNTDKMANAALTDDEKKLNDADEFYAQFSGVPSGNDKVCHSEIGSFALILENKLSIRGYVDVSKYETNCKFAVKIGETAEDMDYADAIPLDEVYSFIISDIGLDEMDKVFHMKLVVTHEFYEEGIETPSEELYFGYAITYSVETYAARMIDTEDPTLASLIRAMMQFGSTVKTVVAD